MTKTNTSTQTRLLFEPTKIKDVTFKNRIAVSPMCQYSSVDGLANDWHLVHLGNRAVGGAGLIIAEATAVEARGRISPADVGLWRDDQVTPWKKITRFLKEQGTVPGIQLAHAGRKASTYAPHEGRGFLSEADGGWQVVSASAQPYNDSAPVPQALTQEQIADVVRHFRDAAARALAAGFELIEIHAAHGYLLHQFLSPHSNRRDDAYGGTLNNRSRMLMQVIAAVKSVWPEKYPLWVRISATDWLEHTNEPSWTLAQSVALAKALRTAGVDVIDVSSGGLSPAQEITVSPGYQVPAAATIKNEANIQTAAVGLITEPEQAEEILQKGRADFIALGRELLRNPYWPLHAAKALGVTTPWPVQYARAVK
ncbi:NADH:flavin oxidoreductase/NADH oxidase [Numidum massiliense]|uniref:NADH:flavin oxidoreductase/NADH oxidase n=1 Tax=Numidum massiliense TaxID=1522315 RepID=UPI001E4D3D02|nr:NADH:flavin oxidoreductase/NADH oxidase [Numidum massiliense]